MYNSFQKEIATTPVQCSCYCAVDGKDVMINVIGNSVHMTADPDDWKEAMPAMDASTLIAGSRTLLGHTNGPGELARFAEITDICVDHDNILLICDF